jgi:hypothetical protein
MKTKKKSTILFTIFLCLILAFSAVFFTACDDDIDSASPSAGTQTESTTDGDTGTSADDTTDDVTVEMREPSESLQTVTETARTQKIASLTLDGTGKIGGNVLKDTYTAQGSFNVADQNGDFSVANKLVGKDTSYSYAFLREGSLFTLLKQTEETTIWNDSVTFSYVGADGVLETVTNMEGIDDSTLSIAVSYAPLLLANSASYLNAAMLSLGNFTGSATEEENTVTIDLNKALFTLASDWKILLNRVKDGTTVEAFLKDPVVSAYMEYLLSDFSASDISMIRKALLALLTSDTLGNYIDNIGSYIGNENISDGKTATLLYAFLRVSPDRKSTAYEYLVKLLCSDELSALLTHLATLKDEDAEEVKIAEMSVTDLFASLGTNKDEVISALDEIEENYFSLTVRDTTVELSDAKLVFTLNEDQTIASVNIVANASYSDTPVVVNATVSYSDEKTTLSDISACKVSIPQAIYHDGTRTEKLELKAGETAVTVQPVFQGNALSSFVVTIGGETVENTYDNEKGTLTFRYNETDYVYSVTQSTVSVKDTEELIIGIYETKDNADVVYIKADDTTTQTYTVADFLASKNTENA